MKKILIVEDDQKIAKGLAIRLKAAGYATTLAYDALAGVAMAVKDRPDLVILDISMPAGDGFLVAERIQTLLPTPTPIIFMTASRQAGFQQRAEALGAVGYFEKPYRAEGVLTAIQRALGESVSWTESVRI